MDNKPDTDHVTVDSLVELDPSTALLQRDIQKAEKLLKRAERDMMICKLYLSGTGIIEIAGLTKLTKQRVSQIIKQAGLPKHEVRHLSRDELVGVVMSEEDKCALREEAKKKGVSMSKWTLDLIKEKLNDIKIRERLMAMREE